MVIVMFFPLSPYQDKKLFWKTHLFFGVFLLGMGERGPVHYTSLSSHSPFSSFVVQPFKWVNLSSWKNVEFDVEGIETNLKTLA